MSAQTITTVVNYDTASISGLLNGETITINGGSVTIDADVRWNQQAAVFGAVTLSSTLGGSFLIDGTQVWEVPFSASSGNVPTQNALGSNGVTGGTSAATGELTRVWASGSLDPATAGGAMPATGFIKLRSKTGNFQNGETITLPGGATVTASGAGKRSWISVAAREATTLTAPRLGNFAITGDWHEIGTTDGTDDQVIQFPVADECPALQVETAPGSGVYEWWLNAGSKWANIVNVTALPSVSSQNMTLVQDADPAPVNPADPYGYFTTGMRLVETTANGTHIAVFPGLATNTADVGVYTFRTYIKKNTRRFGFVQAGAGANFYGAIIDFDTAGAVVLNPTSGSPTNTSTTVTAGTGTWAGWYLVELTLQHAALADVLTLAVGTSNSASPTLVTGRPSFVGVATEGIFVSEGQIVAPNSFQFVNSADVRGKYFFSNPTTGALTFAKRAGYSAGLKPATGLRVRIPNVILSSAAANDYARNTQNLTVGTRYDFTTTAAGAVNISHAVCNWWPAATNAFIYTLQNCAAFGTTTSVIASTTTITNCGFGMSRDFNLTPITISNSLSGGTITDVRASRHLGTGAAIALSTAAGFTLTRVQAEIGQTQGRPGLRVTPTGAPINAINIQNCSNVTATDCSVVSGAVHVITSANTRLINTKYADRLIGTTDSAAGGSAIDLRASTVNTFIDGWDTLPGLTNVHPYNNILEVSANCDGVEFRGVGTPAAPFDMGSAAACGLVLSAGTSRNVVVRRVYTANTRTSPFNVANAVQGFEAYNFWGDAADAQATAGINATIRGGRYTNSVTGQTAVYGTHWQDAFTATTTGRLVISCNEPTADTVAQCAATLDTAAGSGFTSAGNVLMKQLTDVVEWTMPYFMLGVTGFANAAPTITGTNPANHTLEFQYDLNDNNGFNGSWLTLNGTNLSGITVDPTKGIKLKVRATVNTASTTNLLTYIRIDTVTNATDQQIQYPLPTTQNIGTVTNIRAGSRIWVFNVTTATEIANEVVSGTSWTYPYDEGTDFTDGDIINVRLARCLGATATIGFEGIAVAGSNGWSLFADQADDTVYNTNGIDGTTVTDFIFDYPNVEVDIDDPDGSTTIARLYAWWANETTTEEGIRTLIGGLIAEDSANYKIVTDVVDLKLDNTASTGVIFTGDLRLYRDDGLAPVVSSTSGGGSITLYAGKVYTSIVSTASPVITGDISDVPAAVQTGLTAQGYTTARAGNIDKSANAATLSAALSA
jgi:hypothetical protein